MTGDEPAHMIMRQLLGSLHDVILVNIRGVRQGVDPEFLHDFRVATRRTRSLLSILGDVFEPEHAERFRDEFRWLGTVTGPLRDLDMHPISLAVESERVPLDLVEALEPVKRQLRLKRARAQEELVLVLNSKRFRELMQSWLKFLGATEGNIPKVGLRKIARVSTERLWKLWRRIRTKRSIGPDEAPEAFHRLRIDIKKLRYMLEFFRPLTKPVDSGPVIVLVKDLQESLGRLQDADVQGHALTEISQELLTSGCESVEPFIAVGRWIERCQGMAKAGRSRSIESFRTLTDKENRRRFRRICRR